MTTTATPAGTELVPVASGVLAQVKGTKAWTIADLAEKLAPPAPEIPGTAPFPAPARPVKFTDGLRSALRSLPQVFGRLTPTERRKLEAAELAELTSEAIAISAVTKPLGERLKSISEIIRHHMDCAAESGGAAGPDTDRVAAGVAAGHYLLARPEVPFDVPVDGFADSWQQRFVRGQVDQDQSLLEGLLADGKITRQEYLACTRTVRVLDENKIAELIRKDPERGVTILGAITTRSAPGASLYAPKK